MTCRSCPFGVGVVMTRSGVEILLRAHDAGELLDDRGSSRLFCVAVRYMAGGYPRGKQWRRRLAFDLKAAADGGGERCISSLCVFLFAAAGVVQKRRARKRMTGCWRSWKSCW